MKTRAITTIMITLFLASMFTITLGVAPVTAKASRYVQEDWQLISPGFIVLDSFARMTLVDYYGEPVYIVYNVTNTWTIHVTPKGDVHLTSQQNGIAEIYSEASDNLIETRDFFCHETGIDRGMDNNGWWILDGTWWILFDFFAGPDAFANLEHWNIEWKIQGLYLFKATIIDGLCVQCEHGVSHEWVHP